MYHYDLIRVIQKSKQGLTFLRHAHGIIFSAAARFVLGQSLMSPILPSYQIHGDTSTIRLVIMSPYLKTFQSADSRALPVASSMTWNTM